MNRNNTIRQIKEIDSKLLELQIRQIAGSSNTYLDTKRDRLVDKRESILNYNHLFWKQRAKSNFLIFGDRNTKYYQSITKIRNFHNKSCNFLNKNGTAFEDEE